LLVAIKLPSALAFFRASSAELLLACQGKIVDESFSLPRWLLRLDQAVNLLERALLNPNLAAGRTDLGRDMLEQVHVGSALLLMGNGGVPGSGVQVMLAGKR
jgi:hypothetical protein